MLMTIVLVALAGGLGAASRLLVDGVARSKLRFAYPVGTTIINVTGSLLIGLATGLAIGNVLPEQWHIVVCTGFLGGYTTFSTASFETVRLIAARRFTVALLNGVGMLVVSVLAAGAGLWLGSL